MSHAFWVRRLSQSHPTPVFHASTTNPFAKGSLLQLLRQYSSLHADRRKQISVVPIGDPDCGKPSIVNTLQAKKVCAVAPISGETKVWQCIALMCRIYLIDFPGIVPPSATNTPEDLVLRGVVRVENVHSPEQYTPAVLARRKPQDVERTYEIRSGGRSGFKHHIEFLEMLAGKSGRLLKGEADLDGVAGVNLNDFIRGKLPWFTLVPKLPHDIPDGDVGGDGFEAAGRLGEMRKRRLPTDDAADSDASGDGVDEREKWSRIVDGGVKDSGGASTAGVASLVVSENSGPERDEEGLPKHGKRRAKPLYWFPE